jgi:hemoglobin/transferrin/lactoferrin receptor protein
VFVVYPVVASVPVPAPKEEALPGIPPLESRFGVQVHQPGERPRWGLELSARVVDEQDRIAATLREQRTPGFTTLDLRSYCRPADNLSLIAGVENLTDKQYQEHLDIRRVFQPGISFYFGSEVRY